jgi:hypothetical protein
VAPAPALSNKSKKAEGPERRPKDKEVTAKKERGVSLLSCENLNQPRSANRKNKAEKAGRCIGQNPLKNPCGSSFKSIITLLYRKDAVSKIGLTGENQFLAARFSFALSAISSCD